MSITCSILYLALTLFLATCHVHALPSPQRPSLTATNATASGANGANTVDCYPMAIHNDFYCQAAWLKFAVGIDSWSTYYVGDDAPWYSWNVFKVPQTTLIGSCEMALLLDTPEPTIQVSGADLLTWGNQLLRQCISDEDNSGGGISKTTVSLGSGQGANTLEIRFRPVAYQGSMPNPLSGTTTGTVEIS